MTLTLNEEIDMRIWAKNIRDELIHFQQVRNLSVQESKALDWFKKYCEDIEL